MTVISSAVTMPALGVQFASMANYSSACRRIEHSDKMVSEAWPDANNDVFQPFGIKTMDHFGPPSGEEDIINHIRTVTPIVREKFDGRVAKLFTRPLTKEVLDNQKIDADKIILARDMELISEMPANALLQSAMLLTKVEQARRLEPGGVVRTLLGLGALIGIPGSLHDFSTGENVVGVIAAILGFGSLAVLVNIMWRSRAFDKIDRNVAETLPESLGDIEG